MSMGLTSTPPSVTAGPRSRSSVVIPIDFAVLTILSTPTQRIVLNAGMLNELPSACLSGITPCDLPSGLRGEKSGSPADLYVMGVSTIGQSGLQPCSNAVA